MSRADPLLAPFRRPTAPGRRYVPEIDGLRCLAIAAVIAFHLAGFVAAQTPGGFGSVDRDPVYRLARAGHVGVQLFFVISGMVVALPFAAHRLAGGRRVVLRDFYLRRVTRIEPPYVIALCFWLAAFGLSGLGPAPWRTMVRHFPASLVYLHNAVYHRPSDVMPPAWSLEVEVQFYLLAPLLALAFALRRGRRAVLAAAIVVLTVGQRWLRPAGSPNGLTIAQEGQHFLVGLLLADLWVTGWRDVPARRPWAGDVLATAAAACLTAVLVAGPAAAVYATPPLLLLGVGGALRSRWWLAALRNRWPSTVGGMCYTVYLYHGFFKALPGHATTQLRVAAAFWPNFLLQSALLVPVIVVGSAGLYLVTEKPFMTRRGRVRDQLPAPTGPV